MIFIRRDDNQFQHLKRMHLFSLDLVQVDNVQRRQARLHCEVCGV